VTLPPGRARLATKPAPTGSAAVVITIGIVVVAFFAASTTGAVVTTIRSTLRRTRSAASSGRRSDFCSANQYSMTILFPSIHPRLLSSCRNASKRTAILEAVLLSRKPMWGIFVGCCAMATAPHIVSARTIAKSPTHFRYFDIAQYRFWICDFRLSQKEFRTRNETFSFIRFLPNRKSAIENLKLVVNKCEGSFFT
jgi:hypothetical protein